MACFPDAGGPSLQLVPTAHSGPRCAIWVGYPSALPGARLVEPAIGAAITVVFTFLISFFTPVTFFAAEPGRMLFGSGIAFVPALFGAHLGERITGN
jgi:hypothetical protein